jgi:HEAT repeat protein
MSRRPLPLTGDLRLRTLEGKLQLLEEIDRKDPDQAVPLLLEFLCDQSWHIRDRAVDTLVARGGAVLDPLIAMMSSGLWFTRACVAQALGRIGDPRALDVLVAHYNEENATARKAVASALAALVAQHGAEPVEAAFARAGVALDPSRADPERRELVAALASAKKE